MLSTGENVRRRNFALVHCVTVRALHGQPKAMSKPNAAQILLFPYGDAAKKSAGKKAAITKPDGVSVVLCGTYRRDPEGLRQTFERLRDTGFSVLSPSNPFIETEQQGFVY